MVPYTHLWETTLWGSRLSTTVWVRWDRSVWKPRRSLTAKCHILNCGKQQCAETIFQLTSGLTNWKRFENYSGSRRKVPGTQLCDTRAWGTIFQLKYFTTLEVFENRAETTPKVSYSHLCESLWGSHFSNNVSLHEVGSIWTPVQGRRQKCHIVNSETTLWGFHVSINLFLFHLEVFANLCRYYAGSAIGSTL